MAVTARRMDLEIFRTSTVIISNPRTGGQIDGQIVTGGEAYYTLDDTITDPEERGVLLHAFATEARSLGAVALATNLCSVMELDDLALRYGDRIRFFEWVDSEDDDPVEEGSQVVELPMTLEQARGILADCIEPSMADLGNITIPNPDYIGLRAVVSLTQ